MATDTVSVQGPVTVKADSSSRVAFELMEKIGSYDKTSGEHRDAKYWLSLYVKCHRATHGYSLESVLSNE